ncbi:hypothetical protein [Streptomyces galbus]|uniref:Transmembrane protein PGPGW n=1 Tax=Streptomyces galbus TaxID=33898 RepID=A0ABX1IQD6_STRGB|nr:hypothetical protein [Streptomyces galbus]NKQ27582.1 hypothetical protein [Streptomyces galbus]
MRLFPSARWGLQPAPATQGCVITPEISQGFGLRRIRRWLRKMGFLGAGAILLATSGLTWLWLTGHPVEVVAAVLAALLVAPLDTARQNLKRAARRRRARRLFGRDGERTW